jgi:arylsulfatase
MPCIVKWPNHIAAGSTSNLPSYFPDWFPTLTHIAVGQLPENQRLDGIDLLPELLGETLPPRTAPLVWDFHDYGGIVAIRDGKWKSVRRNLLTPKPAQWELYDLEVDRNETTNLAAKHPEIIQRLEKFYVESRTAEPDFALPIYDGQ